MLQPDSRKPGKTQSWYRATESLLYAYKSFPIRIMAILQQLEIVQEQMMPTITAAYGSPDEPIHVVTNRISSPVEIAAIKRAESSVVQKLERKIKNLETLREIVEVSMDTMLTSEQKGLVKMIYFDRNPWQQTCQEMCIDKNTYYANKNEVVKILAWCFGYLPDEQAEEILGLFMDQALWQKAREKIGKKSGKNRE